MAVVHPEEVLAYHKGLRPGKISVTPTKPLATAHDLSLAYTPGVAIPVLEIEKNPLLAYDYTAKGNLVAVVSNGTAILGLGNRGPLASKPVMEGKAVLFKRFADIDVFDIELDAPTPDEIVAAVKAMAPTFGGINLEDIKAPECFEVEDRLKAMLDIPVFHDDQHGTAIITAAGLINGLRLVGKRADEVRLCISGAGAAALSCAKLAMRVGVQKKNIILVDTTGVVYQGRVKGMNAFKQNFAIETDLRTLADAVRGADVFYGLSAADVLKPEMAATMAPKPLIFAMANPDPEIRYEVAKEVRPDAIIATGRSDYPNQINNVLGFPFIFRGALDVRARTINDDMKFAAATALAGLARTEVPMCVHHAYEEKVIAFGPDYIIPKPFDPRILLWVAPAVAKAAMDTGVARRHVEMDVYRKELSDRIRPDEHLFPNCHSCLDCKLLGLELALA